MSARISARVVVTDVIFICLNCANDIAFHNLSVVDIIKNLDSLGADLFADLDAPFDIVEHIVLVVDLAVEIFEADVDLFLLGKSRDLFQCDGGIFSAYIVGHSGLADTALQIQSSELVPELATNAANVVRTNWEWIEDPYIVGVAPNLPWYGFTDWRESNVIPFILGRLSMIPGPMILRKRSDIESITSILGPGRPVAPIFGDFESGNIVLKVADVWGTYTDDTEGNLFDFRGAYYSSGTIP